MNNHYELFSANNNPVSITRDFYQKDKNGNIKSWTATEHYRSGKVVFESEAELPYSDDAEVIVDLISCVDFHFNDLFRTTYEFDNTFSDRETEEIERTWNKYGSAWLDSSYWQVDYESIVITGPYQVDLVIDTEIIPVTLSKRSKHNWS